jgi:hypothetical protein
MPFSINEFRSQLVGGGARPSLFQVQITNPVTNIADIKVPFMVKAAALPASTTGFYTVPYFGRDVKYGGDRTFEDWTVTVINDEDFLVRNAMEAWSNSINSHISNTRALPQQYKSDAIIVQYSKDRRPIRTYNFEGLYPINISEIAMGWETKDAIEEFTVTFQYDAWTVSGTTAVRNPTT